MNPNSLATALKLGVLNNSWDSLKEWRRRECVYSFDFGYDHEAGPFNENAFEVLIDQFHCKEFLGSKHASDILMIFECEWSQLTNTQRNRLLPCLISNFTDFREHQAHFVISELLGRFYANTQSINGFRQLVGRATAQMRAVLPDGLKQMVHNASDPKVVRNALDILKQLRHDRSRLVRIEAESALTRLAAEGFDV